MHQPCSNVDAAGGKLDVDRHREEIRRLVAEAPDEPTYCEFKEEFLYTTKKDKGELVKDVSSFANTDLEALGGYGYITFGVSNDGRVVGLGSTPGDPASDTRKIVNGHLDRQIVFEYITCEVKDKVGGKKQVAAIVLPDSRRRPHVASRNITERLNNRDKFYLREGEVWVRKTGGRELATAEDIDAMYEGKQRRLVDDKVRPLQERIEQLERDLRKQARMVPELGFGFSDLGGAGPSTEGRPYPVLGNLIDLAKARKEIEWATEQASAMAAQTGFLGHRSAVFGPTFQDYKEYALAVDKWLSKLQDILIIEFVLVNTGRAPAEDVEVVLGVPAELRPRENLPERPKRPQNTVLSPRIPHVPRAVPSKQTSPDSLIGPTINKTSGLGTAEAAWEVGKLYHDRPLFTGSGAYGTGGLLISNTKYRARLSQAGGELQLKYAVRAANVPDTLFGTLVLR